VVAVLALMIRPLSSVSVWETTSSLLPEDIPIVMKRTSNSECLASGIVAASASPNTVLASSNETPCFRRLRASFSGSHSNLTLEVYRANERPALSSRAGMPEDYQLAQKAVQDLQRVAAEVRILELRAYREGGYLDWIKEREKEDGKDRPRISE
jgi:hypothetical protein